MQKIELAVGELGRPVLSVYADEHQTGETSLQAARRIARDARISHGKIQFTTVAKLREVDFQLADERDADEADSHYHVYFTYPPEGTEISGWLSVFTEPVPKESQDG